MLNDGVPLNFTLNHSCYTTLVPSLGLRIGPACQAGLSAGMRREREPPQKRKKERKKKYEKSEQNGVTKDKELVTPSSKYGSGNGGERSRALRYSSSSSSSLIWLYIDKLFFNNFYSIAIAWK